MSKQAALSMFVAVVGGLLIAGCGGGGDSSSDPLSKAEFVTEANAICNAANKRLTERIQATSSIITSTVAALETEIEQIGALNPPSGDGQQIKAILAGAQKTIDAAKGKSPDIVTANAELEKAEKAASEYGLAEACLINQQ